MLVGDDQRLLYARLVPDIKKRRVLLLYPLVSKYFQASRWLLHLMELWLLANFETGLGVYLATLTQRYPSV